jgi:mRNA interferase RelE/StbE
MVYDILIEKTAVKQLSKINRTDLLMIKNAINSLSDNPRQFGYIKLKGIDAYKIRAGKFRIIYEIFDEKLVVKVITITHRKDAYRQ